MPDPIAVSSQSPGLLSDFRRGIKLNKLWCPVMSQFEPARSFPVLSDVTTHHFHKMPITAKCPLPQTNRGKMLGLLITG